MLASSKKAPVSPLVLVVDDDPDFCVSLSELLRLSGYAVTTASNGVEALVTLARERISVILTDLFMPRMDGLELIWSLKKSDRPVPPIIAVTGDTRFVTASNLTATASLLGARAVLLKPFSKHQLLGAIATVTADAPSASPVT